MTRVSRIVTGRGWRSIRVTAVAAWPFRRDAQVAPDQNLVRSSGPAPSSPMPNSRLLTSPPFRGNSHRPSMREGHAPPY